VAVKDDDKRTRSHVIPVLETGKRIVPDAHNPQAPCPDHGYEFWRASCNEGCTAQRSATMLPDLLIVWAAIFGGLTFLAMATD
jgi:hypothetical protein